MAPEINFTRKILRRLLQLLLLIAIILVGFLSYLSFSDYNPASVEKVEIQGNTANHTTLGDTITMITWNVGYGGLGLEQDFFFSGGKNVRPTKELYESYIQGIENEVRNFNNPDFILIQEIDKESKRSYYENQVLRIAMSIPDYSYGFATNYDTPFVPKPFFQPYGKCYSGIMSFAKSQPATAHRFKLAQDASWPYSLFMLKRCYLEMRYPTQDGKDMVIINVHMSAYDDGTVRIKQMDTLREKLLKEYHAGNYVVVGGDWNQLPPDYKPLFSERNDLVTLNIERNFPEQGWTWACDLNVTTNRDINIPYQKGKVKEVVIDYFLLSPNLQALNVQVIDLGFKYSDHQPVYIKFCKLL